MVRAARFGSLRELRRAFPARIDRYKRAHASVPLPDYAAALHALYLQAGKPEEAKKQIALIDIVDRLAQASGEKTNRNLAMIYADQGRLDESATAEGEGQSGRGTASSAFSDRAVNLPGAHGRPD